VVFRKGTDLPYQGLQKAVGMTAITLQQAVVIAALVMVVVILFTLPKEGDPWQ